jgi:hypothetical protein
MPERWNFIKVLLFDQERRLCQRESGFIAANSLTAWYSPTREANMSDWIEREAKREAEEEAAKRKRVEAQQLERKALLSGAPVIFQALIATVKQDIESFNKHFPQEQRKLKPLEMLGDSGFQVLRAYNPPFSLKVLFHKDKPVITYDVRVPNLLNGELISQTGEYIFRLEDSLTAYLANPINPITLEEVSERLLKPAISGRHEL